MSGQSRSYKFADSDIAAFRGALLAWYDANARILPWRAGTGQTPDPYHVWLSEIMLQQTVVAAVIPYFLKFVDKWPDINALAGADNETVMASWAGLGYYARARNLYKCAQIIASEHNGQFPEDEKTLKSLPGIGDYTSAAIRSIAFNKRSTVVDGNIERVISRLYAITTPLPDSKPEIKRYAAILADDAADCRAGDYAQALMDLGAGVCIPQTPRCGLCPVSHNCAAFAQRIAAALPYKIKKAAKPQKHGYIYLIENDQNEILLQRRPERGLLGGMPGFPTSEWVETGTHPIHPDFISAPLPMAGNFEINHVFTHFNLKLKGVNANLYEMVINSGDDNRAYFWQHKSKIDIAGFPTLFRKFAKLVVK